MAAVPSTPDQPHLRTSRIPAFLRDERVLQVLGQIIFAIVIAVLISQLVAAIFSSLASKNLAPNFNFLTNRAGFDISNAPSWYSSNSNYWTAFQVGVGNTFRIVSIGLVLTTLMGVTAGVFLLSSNWLIRTITRTYVEIVRSTPLLLQLFVWYFIVMLSLPTITQAFALPAEGVVPITLRLIIYVVLWAIARLQLRKYAPTAPRRILIITGLLAAFVSIEIAFWLNNTQAAWSGSYSNGSLTNGGFLLYAAVSLLLVGAAWYAPKEIRWQALGVTVGQLIGGLLFYFGIVPNGEATRLEIYPAIFVSVRGFVFPEILPTARFALQ